jgi:phosphoribosylformylglycinamidine (FGAM) synthase-like amidotransferase family enzyme
MKFGIVVFPGSNCDHDAWYATSHNAGAQAQMLWHKDTILMVTISAVEQLPGFLRLCLLCASMRSKEDSC